MAQPQQGSDIASSQSKANSERGDGRGAMDRSRAAAEEVRSFVAAGADAAKQALDRSVDATGEAARAALKAKDDLADTNRWMSQQTSEFWRTSLDPLLNMQVEAIRLFEAFWRQAPGLLESPAVFAARGVTGFPFGSLFGLPAADFKETEHGYTLRVELPGSASEDLSLTIRDDTLAVSAEKREDRAGSEAAVPWISERRFGRIDRTFVLPRNVDRTRIAARLQNGVLDVTLPKTREGLQTATRVHVGA